MNIPAQLRQGDSASWHDTYYVDAAGKTYSSANYTLSYRLAGPLATPLTLTAQADGSGWKTAVDTTTSATLVAGTYWWSAVLTAAGERVTIGQGETTVTPDLGAITGGYDGRSLAEKALADAESALASFRSSHGLTKKYTIGMRSMEFADATQILAEISYWKLKVSNERTASLIAQGLGNPKKLHVRFA